MSVSRCVLLQAVAAMTPAERLIRLQDVQRKIEQLRSERDALIRDLDGEVGVRELGRFLGLSGAQVSRIRARR